MNFLSGTEPGLPNSQVKVQEEEGCSSKFSPRIDNNHGERTGLCGASAGALSPCAVMNNETTGEPPGKSLCR
jgi:hypothetical protein